ncbi:hypothetical protein ACFL2F_04995 [Myxococcota bacterium]
MDEKIRWLRISYWAAAIADFIVAVLVLIPGRMGVEQYVYPMGLMSAVAFSWGVMLIFADRRPVERRWMLVPTMLVVALLGGVALHAGLTGLLPLARALPPIIASVVVFSLLLFSHIKCRDLTP